MSDPFETPSPLQPQPSHPQRSSPQQAPPYQTPPSYRQQAPYRQQPPYQPGRAQSGLSDNAAGGLTYLVIPAIFFLIVPPYNRNRFVRFHSWQSVMLFIALIVVEVGLMILGRIPGIALLEIFIRPLVDLAFFVVWIIVLIQAFTGKMFKIPIIGDLAEKQADA